MVYASFLSLICLGFVVAACVIFVYVLNLSHDVRELKRRLVQLETLLAAGQQAPQPTPELVEAPREPPVQPQPPPASPKPPEAAAPAPAKMKPEWDLEAIIGGNWLNRIGVLAFLIGAAFFLKYAFDNRWIGETGRVILGLIAGLVFLALGERYQRKDFPRFAQGLTGGGIALLYLSIYAAFGFYHLIPQVPAFLFMILVTIAGVALAVRYNAIVIATTAALGGFLTPFLLSTGVDNQVGLFTYILLLNAGILGVAYFRHWPILNYQSFVLTVITFAAWAERFYQPSKLWTTVLFLTLLFVVFAFLTIFYNIIHRRNASAPELILAFLNAGIYFGAMYFLLEDKYGDYLGLFSLAMGGAYVALAYLANVRHDEDRFLVWVFLGLAATFVTLAAPIQLKQNWITVGWAVEGAILAYIGFKYDSGNTLLASLAIIALVFVRLIFFDVDLPSHYVREEFSLLFNKRVFSYVVGVAAILFAAYCFANRPKEAAKRGGVAVGFLLVAANLLAIVLLSVEAHDFLYFLRSQERISPNVLWYAQQLSLSLVWTLYATFLIIAGIWRGYKPLRYMALLLFGVTIFKVFLIDLSSLERFYRIISFVVLGVILIAVSFLYQKYKDALIGPKPAEGKAE